MKRETLSWRVPQVPQKRPSGNEWQFEVPDREAAKRLLEETAGKGGVGRSSVGGAKTLRLADIYHDTEDWRLWRAGYALRVRSRGKRSEATLKSLVEAGEDRIKRRRESSETLFYPKARQAHKISARRRGCQKMPQTVGGDDENTYGLSHAAAFTMGGLEARYATVAGGRRGDFPEARSRIKDKPWKRLEKAMKKTQKMQKSEA